MRFLHTTHFWQRCSGVSLLELIVFLVVVSLALAALVRVYTFASINSVDPLVRARALEITQAQIDDILTRKFDENTPTGGIPACGSSTGPSCLGISPDGEFDDVGDYDGLVTTPIAGHTLTVSVVEAGAELGLPPAQARRITVQTTVPGTSDVVLSVYKTNF